MWIESLRVEGGVLDGFHQRFSPGLNVIIGGRGTGKSSVIELLRFCLNSRPYVQTSTRFAFEHAVGILGDGRVEATVVHDGDRFTISRTALETEGDTQSTNFAPYVFSQSEIEAIGLQSSSRLRLIDDFLPQYLPKITSRQLAARIQSLTIEIRSLLSEAEDIAERLDELPALNMLLDTALAERKLATTTEETARLRAQLENLAPALATAQREVDTLTRSRSKLGAWLAEIDKLLEAHPDFELKQMGSIVSPAVINLIKAQEDGFEKILEGRNKIFGVINELGKNEIDAHEGFKALEHRARTLRLQIEEQQVGASSIDRRIGDLSQKISALKSLDDLVKDRQSRAQNLRSQREKLLDELDANREELSKRRRSVVVSLNSIVSPSIRLSLEPFSQRREYISVISGALRGSGLKYNELAARLAHTFSPRELGVIAEEKDSAVLLQALDLTMERAYRLCSALGSDEGSGLFTVTVEDDLQIDLLDGSDYKPIGSLSTGQRCTAILPIILAHQDRTIILDQPEDHLDNAFVVKTLVRSLAARSGKSQTIIATHNPNVPVLGNASNVLHMDSNGTRCFVRHANSLDSHEIVDAISTIMEGGREAFARRATFYRSPDDVFS